jgi:hypothetical protein
MAGWKPQNFKQNLLHENRWIESPIREELASLTYPARSGMAWMRIGELQPYREKALALPLCKSPHATRPIGCRDPCCGGRWGRHAAAALVRVHRRSSCGVWHARVPAETNRIEQEAPELVVSSSLSCPSRSLSLRLAPPSVPPAWTPYTLYWIGILSSCAVYTLATVPVFLCRHEPYKQTYLYQKQNSCDGRCGQVVNPTPLPSLSLSPSTSKRRFDRRRRRKSYGGH